MLNTNNTESKIAVSGTKFRSSCSIKLLNSIWPLTRTWATEMWKPSNGKRHKNEHIISFGRPDSSKRRCVGPRFKHSKKQHFGSWSYKKLLHAKTGLNITHKLVINKNVLGNKNEKNSSTWSYSPHCSVQHIPTIKHFHPINTNSKLMSQIDLIFLVGQASSEYDEEQWY